MTQSQRAALIMKCPEVAPVFDELDRCRAALEPFARLGRQFENMARPDLLQEKVNGFLLVVAARTFVKDE
jgi:hypothetical protein